jgi:hypothetical protein
LRRRQGELAAILKLSLLPGRQAGRKDLPNISKESLGFSKFFQGFLSPFCEISKACKGKKEKKVPPNFSIRGGSERRSSLSGFWKIAHLR